MSENDTSAATMTPREASVPDEAAVQRAVSGYIAPDEAESRAAHKELVRSVGGYRYVAEAAPGHDVPGIWHSFPYSTRTGYATHAIALHASLERLGVVTMLAPTPLMMIDIEQFPKDREQMLLDWTQRSVVGKPYAFIASFPPDYRGFGDLSTMTPAFIWYVAFEALPMSDYAVAVCNDERLSKLWCVSKFTARCYIESGVKPEKVAVVPPAICDGPWKKMFHSVRPRAGSVSEEAPFVFGTLGSWHERKGFHHLVRAYWGAFKRNENVALHIRTSPFVTGNARPTLSQFEEKVMDELAAIAREFGDDDFPHSKKLARVKLLTGTSLTDGELIEWLGGLDSYVSPSFGEGLGIPAIWSAAGGVPLITSSFGALGDFGSELVEKFDRFGGVVFPASPSPVPRDMLKASALLSSKSQWGGYEPVTLGTAMRTTFERGPLRSIVMADHVRAQFSFERTVEPLVNALKAAVPVSLLQVT